MSFPSCIKIPGAKINITSESINHNDLAKETVNYAELIAIANECFGSGRWSHAVTSQTIDFVECIMGKYYIGCAAFVRVQLVDGTFHEDMGYSHAESTTKGSAIYSARSYSIALALKKALLCFGNEIKEMINKMGPKTSKARQDINKLREEKYREVTGKCQKATGSGIKEAIGANGIAPLEDTSKLKLNGKPLQTASTPRDNKCPQPKDPEDDFIPTGSDLEIILADEFQESSKQPAEETNATTHKDGISSLVIRPTTVMTSEEMRQERKRKQKQKQEEYKRLMKE